MQSKRPALIAFVVVATFLVVAVAFASVYATAYVAQPGCESCHSSESFVAATKGSAHASIECVACHGQSGVAARSRFAGQQVFAMWLRVTETSGRFSSAVPREACLSCHEQVMSAPTDAAGLRINHKSCAAVGQCTECHSGTAHGSEVAWAREPEMQACIACHEDNNGPVECDTCHSGKLTKDRLSQGSWRVTHGKNWEQAHGMGDTRTCVSCHPDDYCSRCHGAGVPHDVQFLSQHGAVSLQADADCESCHPKKFCSDCHQVEVPHPRDFIDEHPQKTKGYQDPACLRCHAIRDCLDCHEYHAHPGGTGPMNNSTIEQGVEVTP